MVELSGREYMVRGRGYIKSIADLEKLVLKPENGTPITVKDVATVELGPEMRRGIADYNGQGDVVGGIVVMRHGQNALEVIEKVKAKIKEIETSPWVSVYYSIPSEFKGVCLSGRAVPDPAAKAARAVALVEEVLAAPAVGSAVGSKAE